MFLLPWMDAKFATRKFKIPGSAGLSVAWAQYRRHSRRSRAMKGKRLALAHGPSARVGHSLTALEDGTLLLFGGGVPDGVHNDCFVLDTATLQWRGVATTGDVPPARYQHTASLVAGKLYVIGGAATETVFDDLHVLDTASWTWSRPDVRGDAPGPRNMHTAAVVGDSIFVFGGALTFDNAVADGAVHVLDTKTLTWSQPYTYGQGPTPRFGHSCESMGRRLVFFGGMDRDHEYNDCYALDTDSMRWHHMEAGEGAPAPRAGHTCTVDPAAPTTSVLICGGFSRSKPYDEVWSLNAITGAYAPAALRGERCGARLGAGAAKVGERLWLYGGADFSAVYDDMYVLDASRAPPTA